MDNQQESGSQINERALQWMQECLMEARKKTAALIQNDLAAIEECLEKESVLLAQWSGVVGAKRFAVARADDSSTAATPQTLRALAMEIKAQNLKNAALARAGLDFSQTLLDVLRPPATYNPTAKVSDPSNAGPAGPILSVKC